MNEVHDDTMTRYDEWQAIITAYPVSNYNCVLVVKVHTIPYLPSVKIAPRTLLNESHGLNIAIAVEGGRVWMSSMALVL